MVRIGRLRGAALHTLAGAYALDALEHADRALFERHLASCEACAQEVRGLRETTAVLGSAVSASPPGRMREQVLTAAARTRQHPPVTPDGQRATGRWPHLRAALPRVAGAVAAASLATAVTLATLTITMQHRLDRADERSHEVAAVLTARDAAIMTADIATGGRCTLVMSHAKRMIVFSVRGLHALPGARSYELWLMGPAGVRSAGMLPRPSHGMTAPMVVSCVASGDEIGLTVEPGGGSPHPTTRPVMMLPLPS